jgi:hypothetical protein
MPFSKIENDGLENSKHLNFLYSINFSYEEFNKHYKSKFRDDFIYF